MRFCELEVLPLYDGKNITLAFIEGRGDESNDLLLVNLTPSEAIALADILRSAAQCKDDQPTYALRGIRITEQ